MLISNTTNKIKKTYSNLKVPIIPLKDAVIMPNMVVPLFIGRQKSIYALDVANKSDHMVLLLTQKNSEDNEATADNIYQVGTLAKILQILKLPDGTNKVLVEGQTRAQTTEIIDQKNYLEAKVEKLITIQDIKDINLEATRREIVQQFSEFAHLNQKVPDEIITWISKLENIEQLTDVITNHVVEELIVRQQLLETVSLKKRLHKLLHELHRETEILNVEKRIQGRVKQQIDKNQKEYYLHEQAKAIQQELGEEELSEVEELTQKIKKAKMPELAEKKALGELKKLKLMPPMSSESSIVRNYLEHLIELPWNKTTKINKSLPKAISILNNDHYGLEKIKDRIVEFLAVQQRTSNSKSPILCFVGPPGVGKTSLGESIARATGRKYIRMALGGVHDEAEIRGHRKTYIGAMPGKILQTIAKSGVKNPLFLIDEIDKIGADHRGDPSSALLEVLDPEQNKAFVDNYTETPFDLSNVMFIATANSLNIPKPLKDRMEIIMLSGYTEQEKLKIATQYLLPRQLKNTGLKNTEVTIKDDVILDIIRFYTIESGVRNLERQLNKLCCKIVMQIDLHKTNKVSLTQKNLATFLGVPINDFGIKSPENRIGRVTGLAWTEVGGEILTIEVVAIPGKGQVIRTGKLGDVMLESIQTAISLVRSRAETLNIDPKFYENKDIHVHVPDGATPKDGPSAGIAMAIAVTSSLTHIPVKASIAMTGEVTLYGEVLPIGGLKEKLMAALRAGIHTIIIPEKNKKDLMEIPVEITKSLDIIFVKTIDQVFDIALEYKPSQIKLNEHTNTIPPLPALGKNVSKSDHTGPSVG